MDKESEIKEFIIESCKNLSSCNYEPPTELQLNEIYEMYKNRNIEFNPVEVINTIENYVLTIL